MEEGGGEAPPITQLAIERQALLIEGVRRCEVRLCMGQDPLAEERDGDTLSIAELAIEGLGLLV